MIETALVMVGVFLIAFIFAPVGMGGGMLFAPLLHYVADWPIDGTLLAVSLFLTWAVSIGSGLRHRREGFHHPESTRSTLYGALMGALIGVGVSTPSEMIWIPCSNSSPSRCCRGRW